MQDRPAPLAPGEVHLWLAALNGPASEIDGYARLLSDDERARAARFLRPADRARFVTARGFLRTLLGAYTSAAPLDVRFAYNSHGKPSLPEGANPYQIEFNLSHSGDWALLVIAQNQLVGVDLERVVKEFDCRPLIRRFLSPFERADFDKLPPDELPEAWFRFWTIKEACAKAEGTGLFGARNADPNSKDSGTQSWEIETFVPCSGYAAAVAAQGEITNLVCRRWAKPC